MNQETEAIIGKDFPWVVIPLIESAKRSIKIVVFDWRWYPNDPANPVQVFNHALVQARRRGVNIEVVANCEDVIKILNTEGIRAKKLTVKNLVHCKMIIIDDEVAIVGSHNFSQKAFTENFEVSALIKNGQSVPVFASFFNSLYSINS